MISLLIHGFLPVNARPLIAFGTAFYAIMNFDFEISRVDCLYKSILLLCYRSLVFFVMENALYLTMSQGMLYLKDPQVSPREKPLLKRELGTEMVGTGQVFM